ncbi:hypothetical protein Hanom_Chr14g01280871 [Helianthus anomalus]
MKFSTALTGAIVCLLFTCPNHLNLTSLIFSNILATPTLSLKTSFLIRSSLLFTCPNHLNPVNKETKLNKGNMPLLKISVFVFLNPQLKLGLAIGNL